MIDLRGMRSLLAAVLVSGTLALDFAPAFAQAGAGVAGNARGREGARGQVDARKVVPFVPGVSSDTLQYVRASDHPGPIVVEDAIVQASQRTAVMFYQGGGPFRGTTFRNVLIHVAPGTLPNDRSYWAFRGYDMIDTVLENVEITGFGVITPQHGEGHAIYLNVAGPLTIQGCKIHHNGGQGVQLVNRPGESVLPPAPAQGTITIKDSMFRENGFNPSRGAFQISIFGTGQDIVMDDVAIYAGFDETEWPGGFTRGALLIECEGYNPGKPVWWRPDTPPDTFRMPYSQGRTELSNVRIRHRKPDRPIIKIKGCKELIVRDCTFEGGEIVLDLPEAPGRDCGKIVWEGNSGSAPVFHKGQIVGRARDDFTYEPED